MAQELDVASADYVLRELWKRENEREKREREFWVAAFSNGQGPQLHEDEDFTVIVEDSQGNVIFSEDEVMARSPLGRR